MMVTIIRDGKPTVHVSEDIFSAVLGACVDALDDIADERKEVAENPQFVTLDEDYVNAKEQRLSRFIHLWEV